jgi:hypothetical protein
MENSTCVYLAPGSELTQYPVETRDVETRKWIQRNKASVDPEVDVPMSMELGVPIETCYPCKLAADLTHFGRRLRTDPVLLSSGFLQFECPGGAYAPVMCGSAEVSLVDSVTLTSGPCQCKPGLFRDAQDRCSPCEAGYRCPFGATAASGVEQCPVDTYSLSGSSACTACSKETGACAPYQALTRCSGVGFQTRDSMCVDCNDCAEVSGSLTPGVKPCLNLIG